MKSRGVYETPWRNYPHGGSQAVKELVLDRATMEVKKEMGDKAGLRLFTRANGSPAVRRNPRIRNLHSGVCNR